MELYEGLITRRSVRNYTGEKISEDKIEAIITAGMYAPSARNCRPWHFIVVDDREVLKKIMAVHPYSSMLQAASHAIVVCGDTEAENGPGYYRLDCSAATQNILLAAHSLDLGAVWLGVVPREERMNSVSKILGLPPTIIPLSIVSIGVPAKKLPKPPERFEREKIRRNKW
jgi:nitroreductase